MQRKAKRKKKHKPYKPKDIEAYRKRKREYARTPIQRQKASERRAKWRKKNRLRDNQRASKWRKTKKGKLHLRRQKLKCNYGITPEQYDQILQSQNGVCAICNEFNPRRGAKYMPVDHCHNTLQVRGILCTTCNAKLGWYEARRNKIHDYLDNIAQVLELLK